MALFDCGGKLYHPFTTAAHPASVPNFIRAKRRGLAMLIGIAVAMFVALFAWGAGYFGWSDPEGKVQLALFTSFILGALCGFKSQG
ncbi:MAG TPA: hypothetical protein VMK31_09385 [Sphingomicrobium sp.]|nr:hypothetical protein [Sphingomicrobium sp.]